VSDALSGGFIGLGRLAFGQSPVYTDGAGRTVTSLSGVYASPDRARVMVGALSKTREACNPSQLVSTSISTLEDVPASARVNYRLTLNVVSRTQAASLHLDLVGVTEGNAVTALIFEGFGDDTAVEGEIVNRAVARFHERDATDK
jgi:hypothetical protein